MKNELLYQEKENVLESLEILRIERDSLLSDISSHKRTLAHLATITKESCSDSELLALLDEKQKLRSEIGFLSEEVSVKKKILADISESERNSIKRRSERAKQYASIFEKKKLWSDEKNRVAQNILAEVLGKQEEVNKHAHSLSEKERDLEKRKIIVEERRLENVSKRESLENYESHLDKKRQLMDSDIQKSIVRAKDSDERENAINYKESEAISLLESAQQKSKNAEKILADASVKENELRQKALEFESLLSSHRAQQRELLKQVDENNQKVSDFNIRLLGIEDREKALEIKDLELRVRERNLIRKDKEIALREQLLKSE